VGLGLKKSKETAGGKGMMVSGRPFGGLIDKFREQLCQNSGWVKD
jgi:hypothetical protein